jgi:hypothetical protein
VEDRHLFLLSGRQALRIHIDSPCVLEQSRHTTRFALCFGGGELAPAVFLVHKLVRMCVVKLFKSPKSHAKRSSFYMVATESQTGHPEVALAISQWKRMWEFATFGNGDEYERQLRENSSRAQDILDDFGPELTRIGKDIWDIQARALSKAPFVAKKSVHSCAVR